MSGSAGQSEKKFGKSPSKVLKHGWLMVGDPSRHFRNPQRPWLGQLIRSKELGRPMQPRLTLLYMALPTMAGVDEVYAGITSGTGRKGQSSNQSQLQGTNPYFLPSLSASSFHGTFTKFDPAARIGPESVQKSSTNALLQAHLNGARGNLTQHDVNYRLIKLLPRQVTLHPTSLFAIVDGENPMKIAEKSLAAPSTKRNTGLIPQSIFENVAGRLEHHQSTLTGRSSVITASAQPY